jgi:hypothetical protein
MLTGAATFSFVLRASPKQCAAHLIPWSLLLDAQQLERFVLFDTTIRQTTRAIVLY